ncbi:DUF6308 family protein [Streptomyces cellulosae]
MSGTQPQALARRGRCLHRQFLVLRQVAGLPETVSALRVCDVAVWMNQRAVGHACPLRAPAANMTRGGVLACEGDGLYQPSPGCVGRSRGVVRGAGGGGVDLGSRVPPAGRPWAWGRADGWSVGGGRVTGAGDRPRGRPGFLHGRGRGLLGGGGGGRVPAQ